MKKEKLHVFLRNARRSQSLSLRKVSALTDGYVSNPYVSKIEMGQVTEISPHVLRLLARALKLDYISLMLMAGYLTSKDLKDARS